MTRTERANCKQLRARELVSPIHREQQQAGQKSVLLGPHRKNEVGVLFGKEEQPGLRPVAPALSDQAAGSDRNLRLGGVIVCAPQIGLRIEPTGDSLTLMMFQQVPNNDRMIVIFP